jgi:hypothetical protein
MAVVSDTFPAPVLNSSLWFSSLAGSVGLTIGSPIDGAYPITVDDDGDEVLISSKNKVTVPGNSSFDSRIFYEDTFTDTEQSIVSFLGWRSLQESGGNPDYGVDLRLKFSPGPIWTFQQSTIVFSTPSISEITFDPTNGGDGGFRITRAGTIYTLYRYDTTGSNWVQLTTVNLGFQGPGYIIFGQFAEDPSEPVIPWFFQT